MNFISMYKPKDSVRWQPKVALPIRLDDQCLNVVFVMFVKTAEKLKSSRNIREKKALREFISKNLPASLQERIIQRCLEKLAGVHTTLNLLDMFEPGEIAKHGVDLLGPFRLGFGCYLKEGRLTWSQGSAKKFNLTLSQLEQLYNVLLWSQPSELKELTISIARDTIKISKFPNILAQARSLTKVVILSGAENHTLRILGLNCPCLVTLDVSHSIRITDQGLRGLLLKHPARRRTRAAMLADNSTCGDETDLNPCSQSISCIILIGTSVTWPGCDLACKLLNYGYYSASLPFIKIVRVKQDGLRFRGLPLERQILSFTSDLLINEESREIILSSAHNTLLPDQLQDSVLDFYSLNSPPQSNYAQDQSFVFVRDSMQSFKIHLYLKMEASHVTSLILPWYTFTWRLDSLVDIDTIGMCFPNLRFLKGRIKGRWNRWEEPLLPRLQAAYVWSLNSSTALSLLENIPALKFLEFNNTQTLMVQNSNFELTDETLEASLIKNPKLASNLKSFTIRPSCLTLNALKTLTNKCPNIRRIGDLESWAISSQQISEFNAYLDSIRSQCVLTVMNFPPEKEEEYSWVF